MTELWLTQQVPIHNSGPRGTAGLLVMHLVEVVRNKELVYVKEVPVARATRLIRECAVQDFALQVNAQINERNISLSVQAPSET